MTATGAQFRDFAVAKKGFRYEVGPTRTTGVDGYFDCSGLMVYAAHACGLTIPTVSSTIARWCHAAGTDRLPIETALKTPGALLFMGPNFGYDGWGPDGHICASMGNNRDVIEARGHAYGVLIDSALNRPWTNAARMPGLDYSGTVATPGPITEGNSMYAPDEICSVYTDHAGHAWGLLPTGAVLTLVGDEFYGAYGDLRDAQGHPLPARTDFAHITARFDGKPGYTLWPVHYVKGQIGYSLPTGH